MKETLKYIISLCLIALVSISSAQEKMERQAFVRIGLDASRFALPYIHDFGMSGIEGSIDGEIKYRFFPTFEAGIAAINDQHEFFNEETSYKYNHHYELNGSYFRLGLNYNMVNYKHRLDRNIFYVGARYAIANYSHQADNILIDNIWGEVESSFPETKLSNQWFEGLIGIRGEIFKNFFMGYTIRVKTMLIKPDYKNFTPFWVPGFGKATKTLTMGMTYSIFYAIPIKKTKLDFEKTSK